MKYYQPKIGHQLKPTKIVKRREFSQEIIDKIKEPLNFREVRVVY